MQGLGILSSSSGVLKSGAGVTAACDFGRKFSNSVSGSRAFVVLDPKNAFSNGSLKFSQSIIAPGPQWRCTYSKRSRRNFGVRAAGNYDESSKPIAPLQLESPTGQFLSQLLKDHPHLLPAAVEQQLERLVADRDAAAQQDPPSSTSTELVLYRRIAEVKAAERRKALEEIIYALIVQKFMDARISLIPCISMPDPVTGQIDTWPKQDHKLEGVHSSEAFEMIKNHLALVLGNRLLDSSSIAQISKLRVGQVYAASVMYGYFLRRVDQRFQLEKSMKTLPSGLNEESDAEQTLGSDSKTKGEFQTRYSSPQVASAAMPSIGTPSEPEFNPTVNGRRGVKPCKLRAYVMSFEPETLQRYATMRSKEGVSIIEKHSEALFGRPEVQVVGGSVAATNDGILVDHWTICKLPFVGFNAVEGLEAFCLISMDPKWIPLLLSVLCLISPLIVLVSASEPAFYESFDEPFEGRWIVSKKDEYKGVWKHEKSEGHEDYGLLVSEVARKYAIVRELPETIDPKDGSLVLQYEVRLHNGLECGGAYLKYLRPQESGWKPAEFDNESPYSIMFGPDKCGATNKVHFIYKHKNPKSGEYVEHHLKYPPSTPFDKLTHVYTAILKPNNEVRILIDGEEKKKANLLSGDDFEPALIPPKTIPDPEDKMPKDWDEREKIPDPDAKKPEDWDEDAPMEIEDLEAEKPEGWLDDEPEEIDDPEATKPDDWDDDEDGEWEAPKISNPKCDEAPGCGEWERPMKSNPDYKGKWFAPMIDNPNYKGIWKPQQIPNPDFFELEKPEFEPIAAIGIEIWTMQDGILFDNILITRDEKVAEEYRAKTWKGKFSIEKEKQKLEDADDSLPGELSGFQKKIFYVLYTIANIPFLDAYKLKIIDLIEKGEKKPNLTIGILVAVLVVLLTSIFKLLFGRKKQPVQKVESKSQPDQDGSATESNKEGSDDAAEKEKSGDENEIEGEGVAPRQRRSRRET